MANFLSSLIKNNKMAIARILFINPLLWWVAHFFPSIKGTALSLAYMVAPSLMYLFWMSKVSHIRPALVYVLPSLILGFWALIRFGKVSVLYVFLVTIPLSYWAAQWLMSKASSLYQGDQKKGQDTIQNLESQVLEGIEQGEKKLLETHNETQAQDGETLSFHALILPGFLGLIMTIIATLLY